MSVKFYISFSTKPCLVQLTSFTFKEMSNELNTVMILVDLQKEFDRMYPNFPSTMKCKDFKNPHWFESHLSNRKLFVSSQNVLPGAGYC